MIHKAAQQHQMAAHSFSESEGNKDKSMVLSGFFQSNNLGVKRNLF